MDGPRTPVDLEALVRSRSDRLEARDLGHLADPSRLVHLRRLPATSARLASCEVPLPHDVWDALGVEGLYTHQAQALDLVRSGRSVVLSTGTASGKSLVVQAAIGEAVAGGDATALCLYPTKALAHDQLRALVGLDLPGVVAAAYDGDTGRLERAEARRSANVLLTNPEMLHCALLPHHDAWASFLARLRYVFIDELHLLRGLFGSHVAQLIRRLRRVVAHHGGDPVFITASATIGNPAELASAVTGIDVTAVTDDGSPRGERLVAVWNTPLLDDDRGVRGSTHAEVAGLVGEIVRSGRRAIAFSPSRRAAEVVAERARAQVPASSRRRVTAYRGGFLSEERLQIEQALAAGEVDAVMATSALELGVDIEDLDVCVLDGFPGTVASTWQRFGRVGRRQQESLAVLVCGPDQIDQWIAAHPDALFDRPPEAAVVSLTNPAVVDPHLRCAAFELPLRRADAAYWPDVLDEAVCRLSASGDLAVRSDGPGEGGRRRIGRRRADSMPSGPVAAWNGHGWPVDGVGLRSVGGGELRIVRPDGSPVGTVGRARAPHVVHVGAVYLHAGQHHRVVDLDLEAGRAVVEPDDGTTWTTPLSRTDLRLVGTDRTRRLGSVELGLGPITVTTTITGYERRRSDTGERVERVALDIEPMVLETRGVWRCLPEELLAGLGLVPDRWPGALHAAEHAAIGVLPLFAICDRWDVGGLSTVCHRDTGMPTIVVYDGQPGGAGIADLGYELAEAHDRATLEVISTCGCRSGCPSCVQSPKCGNGNEPLDKDAAAAILALVVGGRGGTRSPVAVPA